MSATSIARTLLPVIGALVFSTTFVAAAVVPAQAATAATVVVAHPVAY